MHDKLRFLNAGSGAVVAAEVTRAVRRRARWKGWAGRSAVGAAEALWLTPCAAVHSCCLSFAIDVAFLNRDLQVVKTVSSLGAWRVVVCPGADSALQLRAGALERSGTRRGDYLLMERSRGE